jgi:hypothetical protein
MMIAIGFGTANWVGYAGSFAASHGQWRIPLGMQIPVPVLMMDGCTQIPFSPRWRKFTISIPVDQTKSLPAVLQSSNKTASRKPKP